MGLFERLRISYLFLSKIVLKLNIVGGKDKNFGGKGNHKNIREKWTNRVNRRVISKAIFTLNGLSVFTIRFWGVNRSSVYLPYINIRFVTSQTFLVYTNIDMY